MTPGFASNLFAPGFLSVLAAAGLGIAAFVFALRWARGDAASEPRFRLAYHGMTAALALATFFLYMAIFVHDFRYAYVVGYTSRDLPLLYLFSAFWGGQQGTFLLWALVGALFGYALFRRDSWEPGAVMACYTPTILVMIGLMLDPGGNPFRLAAQVPADGRGLNPLLQDPWMASHPPMVFLGYAAMTVPAVLALVALLKRSEESWVNAGLRFALLGFLTLGIGIVLGGFWAYKVLGWGGYWGWDPVENASLIPWLVGVALFHGLLVQRATGALRRTNLLLAFAGYVLVLYSTFLTRTGVLASFSVHSFAQEKEAWATPLFWELLAVMLVVAAAAAVGFARHGRMARPPLDLKLGWSLVLTLVIALFTVSAALVFIGTTWPVLSSIVGKPSTRTAEFYNGSNLPLYVALLALLGIGPFLAWIARPWRDWAKKLVVPLTVGVAGTATAAAMGGGGAAALLLFFVALVALAANTVRFLDLVRRDVLATGAAVAHVGFALMFLGIVASGAWDRSVEARLPVGQPVDALGMTLTYRGHVDGSEPKDLWRVAVLRPGEPEATSLVTMYNMAGPMEEAQILRRPAILREIARDIYVAPLALEPASDGKRLLDLPKGKPVPYRDTTLTFLKFDAAGMGGEQHAMSVSALVRVAKRDGSEETLTLPLIVDPDGRMNGSPVEARALPGALLALVRMSVEQGIVEVGVDEGEAGSPETLVVEASTKPLMWVLWGGTLLVGIGCAVAAARRFREIRLTARTGEPVALKPAGPVAPETVPPALGRLPGAGTDSLLQKR